MKIITLASAKGGVGKTTNAVFLALAFRHLGYSVAAVDLDPNNSLTDYFLRDTNPETIEDRSVLHILTGDKQADDCTIPAELDLYVIGSTPSLATFPVRAAMDGGAIFRLAGRLKKLFADIVIIDTPPSLGPLLQAGLYAANLVLTPVSPHRWIMQAAALMQAEIARIEADTGRPVPAKAVYSMATRSELETLHALNLDACQTPIMKSSPLAKAIDAGKPLSPKAQLFTSFLDLAREVYAL